MIRSLTVASGLAVLAFAGAASAQSVAPSWGQPVYMDSWGRPLGGTPLSEVETRAYVETGRWADGYEARPHVYVPGQAYGYRNGPARYRGYGYRGSTTHRPNQGYRDDWGYSDDRPRPGRQGYVDRGRYRYDHGPDVYLYDR